MTKKKSESQPIPKLQNGDQESNPLEGEIDQIIRKKRIQNKVLKELIDQLQKKSVEGSTHK